MGHEAFPNPRRVIYRLDQDRTARLNSGTLAILLAADGTELHLISPVRPERPTGDPKTEREPTR